MTREKIIIVGAGLIGAAVAHRVAAAGAEVTVVDAGQPASGASGRSFGWINASFFADAAHHHLRAEGISAWRRLQAEIPDLSVSWPGCLWWEEQGAALEQRATELRGYGYPVEHLDRQGFAARAPQLNAPEEALFFPAEGVGEAGRVTRQLLDRARAAGAQVFLGCRAEAIAATHGRVTGLRCAGGVLPADRVIVAAGTGSSDLMATVDLPLPMLRRPGALVRTQAVPPVLGHIMVSPDLEFRQDQAGRIIAPSSAAHQADNREELADTPDRLAEDTLRRLGAHLPGVDLVLDQVTVAMRPVPGDGLPVVGHCGPEGLYLAVMHSGVTLAALIGELVADEVMHGRQASLLKGYRSERFLVC